MFPSSLQKGDTVAIVCTAKSVDTSYINKAIELFKSWGLKTLLGKNLLKKHHQFAGTDLERAEDLQWAINHKEIKAIICARGGYGTVRIIDKINFNPLITHPKWIIGFSDITVLHNHIHTHMNYPTIHGAVPISFSNLHPNATALTTLREVLFNETITYEVPNESLNRSGNSEGELIGGNLSILYSQTGTNSDIDTSDKILFLEDLCEYEYHIDRMIWNLKKAEKLNNLKGLIIGAFSDIKQGPIPFGKSAYEIIKEAVAEYNYPVCFNFPAGHIDDNRALIFGRKAILEVDSNKSKIILNG